MIIGIDPGLQGAIAALSDAGAILSIHKMPLDKARKFDGIALRDILLSLDALALDNFEHVHVCIEGLLSLPSDTNKISLLVDELWTRCEQPVYEEIKRELKRSDGRLGTKTMGVNWGIIKGLVYSMAWPLTEASPRTWQKVMHRTAPTKLTTKLKSYEVCRQLWPDQDVSGGKRRGFHDGICDALLIAEFLRRELK